MTPATTAKAARLVAAGHVKPLPSPARVFEVEGDHDTYLVTIASTVQLCTCPSQFQCSHIRACVDWLLEGATR